MRAFTLAGILQIRRAQKDAAAARLALANVRAEQSERREAELRTALGAMPGTEAVTTEHLAAMAASRAASHARITEMAAIRVAARAAAEEARNAYIATDRAVAGVEKLEAKHIAREVKEDLTREQAALDEIASTRRTTTKGA